MCLIIDKNNPEPMTAEQDIVCYKVLKTTPDYGVFGAPLYHYRYAFGAIHTQSDDFGPFENLSVYICKVAEYGFHSFATLEDAVCFMDLLVKRLNAAEKRYNFVIVKCTIPTGSCYYKGKQQFARNEENSPDGYCSEAIRIDEIVNEKAE